MVPFGDERTIYVISETAYEEAAGILKPSESNAQNDLSIIMLVKISSYFRNSVQARCLKHVLCGIRTMNGIYFANIQKWLPLEEGIREYQLEPIYPIHQSTLEYKG
ncbi:hypothetical protein ACQ5SI_18585 [Peribacillus frigoritolerans]|uniref:hypothetical protein n=1 Tax=Peribacillus frigoritolerans TaxID=450367 RepID=UPI003D35425F